MGLQENLVSHLQALTRERDPYLSPLGYFFVREYIKAELSPWGEVELQEFQPNQQNIILRLTPPEPTSLAPVIVGAHYDAVPGTPGADDNASGVAVLLELARYFSEYPLKYPLWLVAFDLEEYGLLGSRAYAQALKAQSQKVRLMLSLEMLGYTSSTLNSQSYPPPLERFYPSTGNFIAVVGNLASLRDVWHWKRALTFTPCEWLVVPQNGKLVSATRLSDHASFWDEGYKALMITDTAFLRNPHYHQPSDRLETLDIAFLTGVCQGLIQGLSRLR
jgi:Zn-dependent M28 family amino/carboxypeptidase